MVLIDCKDGTKQHLLVGITDICKPLVHRALLHFFSLQQRLVDMLTSGLSNPAPMVNVITHEAHRSNA